MLTKFITKCLLIICLFGVVQASQIDSSQLTKYYLSAEQIEISNNEILYVIEGFAIPLINLFSDEYGLYTILDEQNMTVGLWNCPRCQELNSIFSSRCRRCNWPSNDSRSGK